jgi:predicted ATP-grasp superfamily ATP-dependent carboligase
VPASVCCVTDGTSARAIAANEQILRGEAGAEFGFTGSITPCLHPLTAAMMQEAEKIAAATGCKGTVGIDFMLGEKIVAIEVNPRFQATVDTVESATGCSLFALHADACRGILPSERYVPRTFAARKILFSDRDMTIRQNIAGLSPVVADIPWPGTELERGQAVVSVFGSGRTRESALLDLDKNITTVRQYLW